MVSDAANLIPSELRRQF